MEQGAHWTENRLRVTQLKIDKLEANWAGNCLFVTQLKEWSKQHATHWFENCLCMRQLNKWSEQHIGLTIACALRG